jgi:hypothetical protein
MEALKNKTHEAVINVASADTCGDPEQTPLDIYFDAHGTFSMHDDIDGNISWSLLFSRELPPGDRHSYSIVYVPSASLGPTLMYSHRIGEMHIGHAMRLGQVSKSRAVQPNNDAFDYYNILKRLETDFLCLADGHCNNAYIGLLYESWSTINDGCDTNGSAFLGYRSIDIEVELV